MRKWTLGIVLAGLTLVGCVFSASFFDEPDPFELTATELVSNATETTASQLTTTMSVSGFPLATTTPDPFQLTATKIIEAATQTAVAFQNAGCKTTKRRVLDIHEAVTNDEAQTVEVYTNSYLIDAWDCDGLAQTRPLGDYSIYLVTFEETITPEVAADLIARAINLVIMYPPEDTMLLPITIQVNAFPYIVIFDASNPYFALHTEFTYEAAMTAYESGLRGQALLDALGIVVPE
jgi:hypothetical protein